MMGSDSPPRAPMFTREEVTHFDLRKAVSDVLADRWNTSLEAEMLQEAGAKYGHHQSVSSLLLPWELLSKRTQQNDDMALLERSKWRADSPRRALLAATDGQTIGAKQAPILDVLRGHSLVDALGATVINSAANVAMPDLATPATGQWLADEMTGITPSRAEYTSVTAQPHNFGAVIRYSRLLRTAAPAGEASLEKHLLSTAGRAIDEAVFVGDGDGVEPQGLATHTGIETVALAGDYQAGILDSLKLCEDSGATPTGFAVSTAAAKAMRGVAAFSGGGSPLLDGKTIHGLPARASSAVDATYIADWRDCVVTMFGPGPRLSFNPQDDWHRGVVGVRILLSVDIIFRRPASFVRLA